MCAGPSSKVFLRRGPGPPQEYDDSELQFWTGYSFMYREIVLNDKFDHCALATPGAVMMIASKESKVIAIVTTATGHIAVVTPQIGVVTFSQDVADGPGHRALCQTAATHLKNSGVLSALSDEAFGVKHTPMTLQEPVTPRPARAAARAARGGTPGGADDAAAPEPAAAAAQTANDAANDSANAAASRRKSAPRKKQHDGSDDAGPAKRAVQPLASGDYVRRDDGTVSKIVSASTSRGWSKTASGRKAKRGEGAVLIDQAVGLNAYDQRLKQLASMNDELKRMQQQVDEAIAARQAAEEAARQAQAEATRVAAAPAPAPAPASHLFDLTGPPPGGGAAAAAAAAAAQVTGHQRPEGMLARLLVQQERHPPEQAPQQAPFQQALLAQLLANENLAAAHDRNQSNLMMMALFMNGGR